MNFKNIFAPKWRWLTGSVLVFMLRGVAGFFPEAVEKTYSNGFFLAIRLVFDYTLGQLPIPSFYLFVSFLFFLILNYILKRRKEKRFFTFDFLKAFARFTVISAALFLLLWGFHYARLPLEKQLHLTTFPLHLPDIIAETETATFAVNEARQQIPKADTNALSSDFLPPHLEDTMRFLLEKVLKNHGFSTVGRVRGRLIHPKGLLMHLGVSGIYLPWIGEGNVEAALQPTQLPFTLAHELAHGYGFADEAVCNFWAYLACAASQNPAIRYAGELAYWRYIASDYKFFKPEAFAVFRAENLAKGVKNDLEAIYENQARYRSWIPFQNEAYDVFLKFQGVEEGIESYNRMVLLVRAYRQRRNDQ